MARSGKANTSIQWVNGKALLCVEAGPIRTAHMLDIDALNTLGIQVGVAHREWEAAERRKEAANKSFWVIRLWWQGELTVGNAACRDDAYKTLELMIGANDPPYAVDHDGTITIGNYAVGKIIPPQTGLPS